MAVVSSVVGDAGAYQARAFIAGKAPAEAPKTAGPAAIGKPAVVVTLSGAVPAASNQTASVGRSFAEVTTDSRSALDANLARMKEAGHTLGMGENQGTQADIDAAFQGLDRRSLHAIASNSGGLFSDDEQAFAQTVMSQQQASAMGLGETGSFMSDPAAGFRNGVRFLDAASPEERASDNWRVNRAATQVGYESSMQRDHPGETAENLDSGDPVVNLLVKGIHGVEGTWAPVHDGSYVKDIGQITLFKGGGQASELQQARKELEASRPAASVRVDMTL